ncbi:Prolyl endopeptidase precursor [Planctomycetes bacterium K23_9]|uniref:prolyl oligopeptidase n=2 Tax=Stieleria marina TaxID=1930275 RepID=A0A517NPD7_9BACT|nr:Prolyl endopeptidase precursor [Planctomycetes bacterium K23_9]
MSQQLTLTRTCLAMFFACQICPLLAQDAPQLKMKYPATKTVDVVDDYFGNQVSDPYRWLEDTESDETAAWIAAQNKVTQSYLESLPQREEMRARLEKLWNYERFGLPRRRGETYFYSHNDGLQDQSVLYKAASLDAEREVLIDPNTLSEDGTVALSGTVTTEDGKLMAYALADGGSDWRTWKVRDVATGKDLDDVIKWVKFSSIAWKPDGSGFFYSRYAAPVEGEELLATNENQKMYFHVIGTDQSADPLVLEKPDHPKWGFGGSVTDDGRYLVIQNWKGSEPKAQIFLKDLRRDDSPIQELIMGFDAEYEWIGSIDDTLYFVTDNEAPKRRLVAVDVNQPGREHWKEVVSESNDVIESVSLFDETFYVIALKDARGKVTRHNLDGSLIDELPLPGVGSVGGFGGRQDATETFFSFTNYVTPASIYRLDLTSGDVSLWRQPDVAFNVDEFVTEQIFASSKDGTKVPIIVTRRKSTKLDGTNQTLLYAYGGFNISLTPSFSPAIAAWIDAGGVYAVANLRGGGEYGRQWHEDGMRLKKQNVFDDFIASAEHLISQGYTKPNLLGVRGGSNGGLLIGAVMTQRPDLFGACLPAVGVMDMLRYHKFTIGWAWATEFGSSDEEDQIKNLLSYSPLHNLKVGTCYPATMVSTADRDDRVVPGHSFKFAAALQAAQSCESPTLIRIETRAGHGAGTPVSKKIDEYADLWAFLMANLK